MRLKPIENRFRRTNGMRRERKSETINFRENLNLVLLVFWLKSKNFWCEREDSLRDLWRIQVDSWIKRLFTNCD